MIIRINKQAEPLEVLIAGLEDGTRSISMLEAARLLRQLSEALNASHEAENTLQKVLTA
jgi:hypothetical protein